LDEIESDLVIKLRLELVMALQVVLRLGSSSEAVQTGAITNSRREGWAKIATIEFLVKTKERN
jgi:hypothetical protein